MRQNEPNRAPVSGTCRRCGCALGYAAAEEGDAWYCCGACLGSDRCGCGCKPQLRRATTSDQYVPTRRMFAARQVDGLNTANRPYRPRAFPFSDPSRGR